MGYLTFYARTDRWQIFRGVGESGELLGARFDAPYLVDVASALDPSLWVCVSCQHRKRWYLERLGLPGLRVEESIELEGRVDALTCAPDGRRLALLESSHDEGPRIRIRGEEGWSLPKTASPPDLSSRLAWLDRSKIAYESRERRLCVVDLDSGEIRVGIPGRSPVAAQRAGRLYAVAGSRAVAFGVEDRELSEPARVEGLRMGRVSSLWVTHDGEVFTWRAPRFWFGTKLYAQARRGRRQRLRRLEDGLTAVLGPYAL